MCPFYKGETGNPGGGSPDYSRVTARMLLPLALLALPAMVLAAEKKRPPVVLKLYSDFICPFCYIAEHSTVERLVREYDVTLDWRGFELHPDTPVGGMPLKDLFPGRDIGAMHRHVQQYGGTFGVDLPPPPRHLANTRKALAVAEYARREGKLDAFRRAAMHAYWKDGKDLENPGVLRDAAKTAGLDAETAVKAMNDSKYLKVVDAMRAEAGRAGVTGIPTFVFPGVQPVVGCQSWEVVEAAAKAAGARKRKSTS